MAFRVTPADEPDSSQVEQLAQAVQEETGGTA
jgi:hypothetical protein